MTWHQAR